MGAKLLQAAEPGGAAGREDDQCEGWIQFRYHRCRFGLPYTIPKSTTAGEGGSGDDDGPGGRQTRGCRHGTGLGGAPELSRVSRRVLITGGAGFVGSHVADAHIARGDRVWIMDDLSSGRLANLPSRAEFVEMKIGDPRARELISDVGFDLINHHAAQIDVRASVTDPIADARTNIVGLINILEAAHDAGTRRVVFVSSGGVVYGEPEVYPTPESAPKRPVSPYGVSKLAGEHYLDSFREVHGLECAVLRYGNVYGPRQDPHGEAGVVAIFCNRLIDGQPLDIYGDGEQTERLRLRGGRGDRQPDRRRHAARGRRRNRCESLQRGHGGGDEREHAGIPPGRDRGRPVPAGSTGTPVPASFVAACSRRRASARWAGRPRTPCARGWRARSGTSRRRGRRLLRVRSDLSTVQMTHEVGDYHPSGGRSALVGV